MMKVLIVDDNHDFAATLADIVESFGYKTHLLHTPKDALDYVDKFYRTIATILLDIEFGPENELDGLDLLENFRKLHPSIPIVMISGKGTIETAVRATKLGAVNFIEKSIVSKEKIKEILDISITKAGMGTDADEIRRFLNSHGIHGRSKVLMEIGDSVIRYGRTDLNVLITGETGTGKKLVAKAIHSISKRGKYPFITVDIPNIPKELFQSELFGHTKGAFSGATETKRGLFHEAHKGSMFLDEIGEMTLDLQSNLFIPIEEKVVRRVGSVQSEEVDVRFISATDKDLVAAMREGKFREQLFHRLRECEINIPGLATRREDIPDIVEFYIQKNNMEFHEGKFLSPSAVEFLMEQNWPGNVRELASIIRLVLQTTSKEQVEVNDLHKIIVNRHGKIPPIINNGDTFSASGTLKEDLQKVDKNKIEATLGKFGGNVTKSAALLGISRETMHNKIRKYEIDVQMFRGRFGK
jgi:two-component system nitrogen regulation response regulator NtrX